MGRELRRKQAKKEGKELKNSVVEEKNQIIGLVKITALVFLIIVIIYFISALFVTKELDWFSKEEENTSTSVANSILASSIFKQSEEEYYVYFYDFTKEDNSIKTAISNKLSDSKVYNVDTNSALNSKYVSEDTNKNAKSLDDLKVKSSTLIKISGDTIVSYYEDNEIIDNLE